MKIKATTSFATLKGSYVAGEIYDVGRLEGSQWIKNGWAEEVKPRKRRPAKKAI